MESEPLPWGKFPQHLCQVGPRGPRDTQIALNTHMFVEEAFDWVEFPKDHIAYARHRINDDGTPAVPVN